jgi:hypothetical protein
MNDKLKPLFIAVVAIIVLLLLVMFFQSRSANKRYEAERAAMLFNIEALQQVADSLALGVAARTDSLGLMAVRIQELTAERDGARLNANRTTARIHALLDQNPRQFNGSDTLAARLALRAWRIRTAGGH